MIALGILLLLGGLAAAGWLGWEASRVPPLSSDEHAATACALLNPDHPDLPDTRLSFIEQVEAYVAAHAPKES